MWAEDYIWDTHHLRPHTGYDGSQTSTLHDNMYHVELANPERVPTYNAQGCPIAAKFLVQQRRRPRCRGVVID